LVKSPSWSSAANKGACARRIPSARDPSRFMSTRAPRRCPPAPSSAFSQAGSRWADARLVAPRTGRGGALAREGVTFGVEQHRRHRRAFATARRHGIRRVPVRRERSGGSTPGSTSARRRATEVPFQAANPPTGLARSRTETSVRPSCSCSCGPASGGGNARTPRSPTTARSPERSCATASTASPHRSASPPAPTRVTTGWAQPLRLPPAPGAELAFERRFQACA
jgi:hypothetical protein